ncbi:MAG: hypothetical protein MZV63_37585 [Marinilabiliales bacterium]|nr:hypothetical protein [Marinilabiliales bacterium]
MLTVLPSCSPRRLRMQGRHRRGACSTTDLRCSHGVLLAAREDMCCLRMTSSQLVSCIGCKAENGVMLLLPESDHEPHDLLGLA